MSRAGPLAGLGIAIVALAAPALAERPPDCGYDTRRNVLVPPALTAPDFANIFIGIAGKGLVYWPVWNAEQDRILRLVLQHCPTGRDWTAVLPATGHEAASQRWLALVDGSGAFTPAQLMQEMQRMGAEVRTSRNGYGRCACDALARLR